MAHALTHARRTSNGVEPYATREDIERGALVGLGLELVWLADAVDCFFMHVQGSGRIRFEDGSSARITYDGKNGHPYTSIGRYLIDLGHFSADAMSLDALKLWLSVDEERGRHAMWQNKSFVFFRELAGNEAESPLGALSIPLSEGRSLAVDTAFHALGTPIYVAAPSLTHATPANGFHRLMIANDVGSAIRGPERGDIYFGSGPEAGALAGITKHRGWFFVLLPREGAGKP
jgi:membrane-bound lytic murein transglycosylase A